MSVRMYVCSYVRMYLRSCAMLYALHRLGLGSAPTQTFTPPVTQPPPRGNNAAPSPAFRLAALKQSCKHINMLCFQATRSLCALAAGGGWMGGWVDGWMCCACCALSVSTSGARSVEGCDCLPSLCALLVASPASRDVFDLVWILFQKR